MGSLDLNKGDFLVEGEDHVNSNLEKDDDVNLHKNGFVWWI